MDKLLHTIVPVLVFFAVVTTGLICQFPHCETVHCDPVDPDNCTGHIRMGGGYCGCCLACFTYIGYREPCEHKDPLEEILHPPTAFCNIGLYCDRNTSTCVPMPDIG